MTDDQNAIRKIVEQALSEDKSSDDVTTNILISPRRISSAYIVVKENAVVCGLDVAKMTFEQLDPRMQVKFFCREGQRVKKNTRIFFLKGRTRAILSAERTALNFLSRLSGIATLTRAFVEKIQPHKVHILDTRKTTPGLRILERKAVVAGGGKNHRLNLSDMVLVKDNHRQMIERGSTLAEAIAFIRNRTKLPLIVEVDNLPQFQDVLRSKAEVILLDNMSVGELKKAVRLKRDSKQSVFLEASGGVTLQNVRKIAASGVDRISIGALTHSAKAIDFSLELIKNEF